MLNFRDLLRGAATVCAVVATATFATPTLAQETVKIGAIYPFSGNAASAGNYIRAAMEFGVDLVNNGAPELAGMIPLAKGGGLPDLGGAKVHALIGAYQSGITVTASAMAEKHGIPFVTPESVAADLTERGFKWFFRVTPVAASFATSYSAFLREQKATGRKIDSIALVNENTEYGNSVSKVIKEVFAKDGLNISQHIAYSANTTDVQPQVLQMKEKNPDVVIFISYTSDAILYSKTMKDLNWKPAIMIADNAGFNDPSFVKAMGAQVEGLINRSSFAAGKPGSVSAIANALLKKKSGNELDDVSARGLQGVLTLLDAINRAGSTEPAKIQAALKATDLPASQMVTGYNGVKFDEKGENVLAAALITQMRGGVYVPVWPKDKASSDIVLPYKGW